MVVTFDHERTTFINAIDDKFIDLVCDLTTSDLQKLYEHFVINDIKDIQIASKYIRFNIKSKKFKIVDFLRFGDYNENNIVNRLILCAEHDYYWNPN